MAKKPCNFPNSLDNLVEDRKPGDVVTSDSYDVIESAINALEQKVGINGSLDPNSHEYKIAHKPNKPPSSTAGNLASLDSNGNLQDSGYKPTDFTTQDDISNKANKVLGAVNDNFVALKSDGDIKDSGKKAADFANVVHTHTGADIISEVSNADMVDGKHASEFEPVIPIKGTAFNKDFGTAEDTVCEGNDERLYDDRPPIAHANSHITGGADTIPDADLEGNSGLMSSEDKEKLNNATSYSTASTLVMRDAEKRAKFADPLDSQDAATKKYVDDSVSGKANKVSTPTENNFASLTSGGDLKDSGKKATDFVEKNFKTATITTTWSGTEAPYIQEITISGITDDHKPIIGPIYDDDVETAIAQQEAWSLIDKIVTDTNKIICYCFTDKPEVAIDIQLWVV